MINGDNTLTACHVARQLKVCKTSTTIILTYVDGSWSWQSVDLKVWLLLAGPDTLLRTELTQFFKGTDMCSTGEGLLYLLTTDPSLVRRLLPHVQVFFKVNPKQKGAVVTTLKALGYDTLMCGDGTNDAGALKHSNVGEAIISRVPAKKKKSTFHLYPRNKKMLRLLAYLLCILSISQIFLH